MSRQRNIEQYKPLKELNVDQARVLLVGQVGAGKSSFFNTINSIFRGYITSQACSGNAEQPGNKGSRCYNTLLISQQYFLVINSYSKFVVGKRSV
jgi:predicted GTPase